VSEPSRRAPDVPIRFGEGSAALAHKSVRATVLRG
jgi:hypothetical protein